jgi:UDP:flavonoid glycosyltransferase YjiC (YdhE family)
VPANTRLIDYLPYDAILEHSDVFVTNGGYGSMMHGIVNGVPMVVAGLAEDKTEVCAGAEYAGFAVNLKTQTPTSQQVYDATDKVLTIPSYKMRAVRHQQENEDLDSVSILQREIMKYARKN